MRYRDRDSSHRASLLSGQPEPQQLGQSAADLDEVKVLEVTTYEGSPVVELEVSPIGLRLHLTSRAAADSLRALAG